MKLVQQLRLRHLVFVDQGCLKMAVLNYKQKIIYLRKNLISILC